MNLNRGKVVELLNEYYYGNYSRFGRALNVDISHLYRFLNSGVGGGKKIMGAVMLFCKNNGLNFEDYME